MSSDWEPTTLGSVCDRQGGSIQTGPFGSQLHASDYVEQGIPVVMPANIGSDGGISEDGIARITQFDADRLQQHKLQVGDVVFSRRGDVTRNALIEAHQAGWLCGTGCLKVRLGSQTQASAKFISYCLRLPETKDWLVRHAVGATMPNLNTSILSAVPILLPELPVQQSIANILGCLDERIDLLRETNATLEAIVQALFKSWFVDFDPVHARARGEQLAGLAPEVAALFPDSFEESALGLVPKGWKYVSLKEATDIFDSKRIPLAGQERAKRKGPYPYYGAAALMDWVDDYIFDGVYLLMGEDGSVADASGYPITQYVWGKIWVNNHAHVLQGRNGISTEHLMLALKGVNIQPFITGAVQAKLSQSNMWRIQFLMPTQSVASAFADLISPMFAKIRANSEQAQTLANLRDTLLPRLISGQLRLPDAEAQLSEVGLCQ